MFFKSTSHRMTPSGSETERIHLTLPQSTKKVSSKRPQKIVATVLYFYFGWIQSEAKTHTHTRWHIQNKSNLKCRCFQPNDKTALQRRQRHQATAKMQDKCDFSKCVLFINQMKSNFNLNAMISPPSAHTSITLFSAPRENWLLLMWIPLFMVFKYLTMW